MDAAEMAQKGTSAATSDETGQKTGQAVSQGEAPRRTAHNGATQDGAGNDGAGQDAAGQDGAWREPIEHAVVDVDPDAYFGEDAATLGDRIAAARQAAGLTQSGLAARLGVGAKIVSSWENDRSEPRANRLAMLAGLLNVSVSWLLTGGGEGVAPPEAAINPTAPLRALTIVAAVPDLAEARRFFGDVLGCSLIEASATRQDFSFFGHVLRAETDERASERPGGEEGPLRRLVVDLDWAEWEHLAERLRAERAVFVDEPSIQQLGAPTEYGAFSIVGAGALALEFRANRHAAAV